MKKALFTIVLLLASIILYWFWSNSNIEAQRKRMYTLRKGMSRAEIEALLSKPNAIYDNSSEKDKCIYPAYTDPVMVVTVCHDSATSASFYEGKSEINIFE